MNFFCNKKETTQLLRWQAVSVRTHGRIINFVKNFFARLHIFCYNPRFFSHIFNLNLNFKTAIHTFEKFFSRADFNFSHITEELLDFTVFLVTRIIFWCRVSKKFLSSFTKVTLLQNFRNQSKFRKLKLGGLHRDQLPA